VILLVRTGNDRGLRIRITQREEENVTMRKMTHRKEIPKSTRRVNMG
jgi:hypothetical protein